MSSVANSEQSHRNSPDHNAGTSSVVVVVVKRGGEPQLSSSPQPAPPPPLHRQTSHTSPTVVEQRPASSLPKQTVKDVVPKTTTVETTNITATATTTTTTTATTITVGAPTSQNNRRRNPLSEQSGGIGGVGGVAGASNGNGSNGNGGNGGALDNVLASQGNKGHPVSPTTASAAATATGDRGLSRACCFCWCCCCSCSSLTVRNNQQNSARTRDANKLEILNGENEPPPTLEDIRAWGESFDRLMRCSAGRKVFRDFLRCEYSEENILFWLACEELKRETNAESVEEKARLIYEDYISILSPKEVSLDSRVREVINRNMVEPSPHTFDEAQLQIYTLMHRDSYPRFVNSPIYKKLAQMNTSSRKESSA